MKFAARFDLDAGSEHKLVSVGEITDAEPHKRDRYHYYLPRWPWMLFSTQGYEYERMYGKIVVVAYNGKPAPLWYDCERGLMSGPEAPDHWRYQHYRVATWLAKETSATLSVSEILDATQALAFCPPLCSMIEQNRNGVQADELMRAVTDPLNAIIGQFANYETPVDLYRRLRQVWELRDEKSHGPRSHPHGAGEREPWRGGNHSGRAGR